MLRARVFSLFYQPQCRRKVFINAQDVQSTYLKIRLACHLLTSRRFASTNCSRKQPLIESSAPPIEYRWIHGVERLELYQRGGYHPVVIDDLLHDRYRIVDKLGFGGYSTIWLARDEIGKSYVAVKIEISSRSLPRREPEILRALHGSSSSSQGPRAVCNAASAAVLPTVLDVFDVRGPNGTHACYTLTPAQGNLKDASFSRLFPIQVARALAAKLAIAIAVVHSRGFVHGGLSEYIHNEHYSPD